MKIQTSTKYKAKTAEECVRQLRGRSQLQRGLILALALLVLVLIFAADRLGLAVRLLIFVYLLLFAFIIMSGLGFLRLQGVLITDCDPVKYLEIMRRLQQKDRKGRAKNTYGLEQAKALWYLGETEEMYRVLCSLELKKRQVLLKYSHLNLLGNYCLFHRQMEDFEACKNTLLAMRQEVKPGSRKDKQILEILEIWDCYAVRIEGERERERTLLTERLAKATCQIQMVNYFYRLAELDLDDGELENTRERLRYVCEHGGTTWMKREAERIAAEHGW